ncbi:choice-of-anchor J domain-containing protein [Saccharicrinis sp. FJH54]|uniref:choice-of-anchor J domain-containing protein n=1 Tax=Saccharicrinis sp. FJH54 TaxID=3344665 RepID=UPI0035D4F288
MKKTLLTLIMSLLVLTGFAQKKILFDNTKNETAGNADWIIDDNQPVPVPAQTGIISSTPENYWQGALSSWGIEMVKRGFYVETLPGSGSITYNNSSNTQDLSNYDIFVVCEPNNPFSSTEKQAMISFVENGGGLFIIADHAIADRDGDGWDALEVWNDFFMSYSNPFGFTLDAGSNISKDPATNVADLPSNTILHGPAGDVDGLAFYNGATFTIDQAANSTALGLVFYEGYSNTGTRGVMAVCASFGKGRVVGLGDSSVAEDETAHDGSNTYPGWSQPLNAGDATGDDGVFMTNATLWLSESDNNTNSDAEILREDFSACPASGWTTYSVTSNVDWTCNNQALSVNGYNGDAASNDWIISPVMDFSGYSGITLSFDLWTRYTDNGITDPEVRVKYSVDYPGSGNPENFTWTGLPFTYPVENSQTWINSGAIDLSAISGTNVYIAFQYKSSGTGAGTSSWWQLDNVDISGTTAIYQHTITTSVNPANSGMTIGSGSYDDGETVTLSATANGGYIFTNWTLNGSVVSSNAIFAFTATEDMNLIANFDEITDITLNTIQSRIKVFPNPAGYDLNIHGLPVDENLDISVVSLNGKEQMQCMSNLRSEVILDVSRLDAGLYFMRISGRGLNEIFKISHIK